METVGTKGCEDSAKLGFAEPITAPSESGAAYVLRPLRTGAFRPSQQPTASRRVRHTCAMRGLDNDATRRLKDGRGTVWMLSKLTTHGVGTPSSLGVNSSSDTKPRCVLVRAATTTEPMRSATGSRVSTSTGRSPPGVAANQISPRCIAPLSPILSRPPVGNLLQRALRISERHLLPRLDIMLATQAYEVSMKSVAKDLRALHPQSLGPPLDLSSLDLRDTKTKHCHTREHITYDTSRAPVTAPLSLLLSSHIRQAPRQRHALRAPTKRYRAQGGASITRDQRATSASVRTSYHFACSCLKWVGSTGAKSRRRSSLECAIAG
jgi:hypothetical protein